MKISKLIKQLENVKEKHGDMPVQIHGGPENVEMQDAIFLKPEDDYLLIIIKSDDFIAGSNKYLSIIKTQKNVENSKLTALLTSAEIEIIHLLTEFHERLPKGISVINITLKRVNGNTAKFGQLAFAGDLYIDLIQFGKLSDDDNFVPGDTIELPPEIESSAREHLATGFISILKDLEANTGLRVDDFDINAAGSKDRRMITLTVERD